jgi:hypothetical protein
VLSTLPRDLLEDLTRTLKARSAWLSCEEQREYKRAKLLNIIAGPADGSPRGGHRLGGGGGGSPGGGMLGAGGPLAGLCSPRRAVADAFCRQVLLGGGEAPACGGGGGQSASAGQFEFAAGSEAQLAGLEMRSEGEGEEGQQHCMPGAGTPFTPFDAPRTKMRLLPPQQGQGQGLQPAAGAGGSAAAAEARLAVAAAAAAEPSSTGGKSGGCMGCPRLCGCVAVGGCRGLACAAPPPACTMLGSATQICPALPSLPAGTPQYISPLLAGLAAAGMTDHQINRISPDGSGEQAATLALAAQLQQAPGRGSGGGGGGRVRQTTLLPDKQSQ